MKPILATATATALTLALATTAAQACTWVPINGKDASGGLTLASAACVLPIYTPGDADARDADAPAAPAPAPKA